VDGLEEAIRIMRGLWSDERLTHEGRLYRTDHAELQPKPGHPIPIWLGTYGPRALALTGRLADGWIPSFDLAPPEQVTGMRDVVLEGAEQAGRAPEAITCVYNVVVRVEDRGPQESGVVSGSPQAIAERLAEFAELGFGGFNLIPSGPRQESQVERLAQEVIPTVRAG
jgi:alkanesulfonate monooxygenase SsuD/methylene tetrahydromethanopterin reductase-like flavin-dependent oxidoreductase (luciferase family)